MVCVCTYSSVFTDPSLTLDNVTTIMKDVEKWVNVAGRIGIPGSKLRESATTDQCKQACWDYWLHHHPAPSWRLLADGLYIYAKHGALEVLQMNYLKGESIEAYHSLLGNWVLYDSELLSGTTELSKLSVLKSS